MGEERGFLEAGLAGVLIPGVHDGHGGYDLLLDSNPAALWGVSAEGPAVYEP